MATGTQLEKSIAVSSGPGALISSVGVIWTRGRLRWAGMEKRQRAWAIGAVLLLIGAFSFVLWSTLRTDWRVLYAGLEPEDARQMSQTLTQSQILFDVDAGGVIRVPAAQLEKARLATAGKGGVKSGRMGFELFDKPNWVGSEFDEQVNYQRALEGELERTIGTLSDVDSARVHLVLAHDSLFRDQDRPAKASVVLKVRHHSLADGEPDSIRNLVASAVDGLAPERVALVDTAGLPLGPRTATAMRLSAEQAMEEKIVSTLEPVTGAGNVRASVTVEYDDSAWDETRETYDPTQTVTLSMQRSEQNAGSQPVAAGVPGTASNAPNSQSAVPVYPQASTGPQSAKTESSTYAASKAVRHTSEIPGRMRRLTAAVVVNDRQVQGPAQSRLPEWQHRSADEIRILTGLAQAAVGFDGNRGDVLTLQDLAFETNRPAPPASPFARGMRMVEASPALVRSAGMIVAILILLAFGFRPALRYGLTPALPAGNKTPALEVKASATAGPPDGVPDPERRRTQEVLASVSEQIRQQPAQSSRLLQSWIHSE